MCLLMWCLLFVQDVRMRDSGSKNSASSSICDCSQIHRMLTECTKLLTGALQAWRFAAMCTSSYKLRLFNAYTKSNRE